MSLAATTSEAGLAARPPAIRTERVCRRFDFGDRSITALAPLSMQVADGEIVAVRGPSGSGKTSLLNIIAGLDRPSEGYVHVLETALEDLDDEQLTTWRAGTLGMVFQEPHLFPGLTALENVMLARLPWERGTALHPRAKALLDKVGLANRIDVPPGRLSAGERQRVSMARALLGQPRLLLADEPTGNLDAASTAGLLRLLAALRRETGLTIVMATHDPAVAAAADREVELSRPMQD